MRLPWYVADVAPGLQDFVSSLLAKDPANRCSSAQETIAAIERLLSGRDDAALAKTTPMDGRAVASPDAVEADPLTARPSRRLLRWSAAAVVCLLAIVGITIGYLRKSPGATANRAQSNPESPLFDELLAIGDKNHDGVLSVTEFPIRRRRAAILADTNNDGTMTREEWEHARDKLLGAFDSDDSGDGRRFPVKIEEPVELMRRFDEDGNQGLTPNELTEIPEQLRHRMMEADVDRDGSITIEELRQISPPPQRAPRR